jgi:succinate dehydrogenase/fumarate reductase flavoprotein subunit
VSDQNPARVVVVGAGGAGLAAALSAAVSGASVTVLESAAVIGGTTSLSGGVVWVPNNPWSKAEGIDDSEEKATEYLNSLALGYRSEEYISSFVRNCVPVAERLQEVSPIRWNTMDWPDYQVELPGGLAEGRSIELGPVEAGQEIDQLVRADPRRYPRISISELARESVDAAEKQRREEAATMVRGRGLAAALYIGAKERGVEFKLNTRATELVVLDGEVVGVIADGVTYAGRVILCSGGFERNAELVSRFLRGPMVAPCAPPDLLGDGLLMGISVGAKIANMGEAWWSPAHAVPGETIDGAPYFRPMFADRGAPGSIVVDQYGRRYANEASNYNDSGRAMQDFDPGEYRYYRSPSWMIFDDERQKSRPVLPGTDAAAASSWLYSAPTLLELAEKIGVPADALQRTVNTYNTYSDLGVDPAFHRGSYIRDKWEGAREKTSAGTYEGATNIRGALRPIDKPPYYAVRVLSGCIGTKGGLVTDGEARVVAENGSVIRGLFAAGNTAASGFGNGYPGGGATIAPALVFGWLAGQAATQ